MLVLNLIKLFCFEMESETKDYRIFRQLFTQK